MIGTIVIIVHILVALALIFIVLLQTGKGASMGAAFGGGASNTVFGSRGPASFLSKITAVAAIAFMLTSLGLSIFNKPQIGGDSIMEGVKMPAQTEPATTEQPAAPAETGEATQPAAPVEQAQPIAPATGGETSQQ